ncbi:MAG: glycosyltransferase [Planctomycetes bacterium]|nr:glycosyltransferase [Planctomycetota bacterium]MCB9872114.1 glycosyltransferase [Planctomycetota bacterium]
MDHPTPLSRPEARHLPVLERTDPGPPLRLLPGGVQAGVDRVRAMGKFLYVGDAKFDVKGVTYGPFRPEASGSEYHDAETVERDFRAIAACGCNAVRVYTVPPVWLLDLAWGLGLRVLIGLPWEQHVTFLDDRRVVRRIVDAVRQGVRACAGHPAVLGYAVGNEIPASIVRWHGPASIERFIARLYHVAKAEDPRALVTYVSYPTTEYLDLRFLDFITFNVYLEDQHKTAAYIARLQNIAGERPLVMAEVGLDSMRNGERRQAETLEWQIRTTFQGGCAGTFVFSWTDEWFRGGHEIVDWAFGLVGRDRTPKPALAAVRHAFARPLLPEGVSWPRISVVVCTYNGARTIRQTFEAIARLDYDNYEVVVVNDGSTDATPHIAAEYGVRRIDIENGGLSNARNVGMRAAEGEIVAYIDDDAYPDPHWLSFLAVAFTTSQHVGIGGPNLAPHGDGPVADCVANSPGGPSHVLFTDQLAEHLPGCNMAFRRDALMAVGGFDVRFRIAGDDVDLCWRLIEAGGTLGFHAGAVVWHHRRARVADYLRQQRNYGRAEAMLEQKWPEKYNRFGHLRWAGKLYGRGHTIPLNLRGKRVHYGTWGSRLFQSMYAGDFDSAWYVTLMPEWYLLTCGIAAFTLLGLLWSPLLWLWPLLAFAVLVPLIQVWSSVARARFTSLESGADVAPWRLRALTAMLHILQPMVRLGGRMGYRLTPWRTHGVGGTALPRRTVHRCWSETWRSANDWLETLEKNLQRKRVLVRRGGDQDRWDLQAACGLFGGARLIVAVEEHGSGRQMVCLRAWPRLSRTAMVACSLLAVLAVAAGVGGATAAGLILGSTALLSVYSCARQCGAAMRSVAVAVSEWSPRHDD